MTDAKQPEPLSLADEAWNFDCSEYRGARAANAAMMGKLQDCADMIRRLHTELETLREKLKTYEDLGDAADDMQLLRTGYAAARLEIESLKSQLHAAKQINAAQFGLLAASIPGSALRASHWQAPAWATKPTEQQILEAAFAPAQPAVEASRFGGPELQTMIIARCVEKDLAASVLEDAARYRFIRDVPYSDDVRSVLVHQQNAAMDRVIDAARKQGASHD